MYTLHISIYISAGEKAKSFKGKGCRTGKTYLLVSSCIPFVQLYLGELTCILSKITSIKSNLLLICEIHQYHMLPKKKVSEHEYSNG